MSEALEAPAPTGDSAGKLAAAIAHKVLDYLNSTPVDEDEERDDWCIVRDIARDVIAPALRQPPQPTGDVGELVERLREVENAERELSLSLDMRPEDTTNHAYANTCRDAADFIESSNSRSPLPAWPHSLHALEHNAAADPKGLVMYFNTEREANDFSIWMARGPLTGAGEEGE